MSTVGKGLGFIQDNATKSNQNLKIKNGESAVVRFLQKPEDIVGVWEYTEQINGKWQTITALPKEECPLFAAGKRAGFKTYLVVLDRSDDKVKIFKASKTVARQLIGLIEEYGDITARDFKIQRTGEKLDTTYQFFPRDPSPMDLAPYADQIPDVEEMVKPMTREAILALMNGMDTVTDAPPAGSTAGAGSFTKDESYPF